MGKLLDEVRGSSELRNKCTKKTMQRFSRCYYITVDFATALSQKVYFGHFLKNIGFHMKGQLISVKSVL
jgi:hypothetical protein